MTQSPLYSPMLPDRMFNMLLVPVSHQSIGLFFLATNLVPVQSGILKTNEIKLWQGSQGPKGYCHLGVAGGKDGNPALTPTPLPLGPYTVAVVGRWRGDTARNDKRD